MPPAGRTARNRRRPPSTAQREAVQAVQVAELEEKQLQKAIDESLLGLAMEKSLAEQDVDDTASDTSMEITGTMSPSHALPAGFIAPPTRLYELSEPWWKTPMRLWPAFRKLSPEEYKALFPPCYGTIHDGRYWVECDHCRAEFKRQNGRQGSHPSEWICRCGNHDLLWHHKARPHHDEYCRPCMEAMRADGIDYEMWQARCKRERDQLISEQLAADKPLMKDMTIFTHGW